MRLRQVPKVEVSAKYKAETASAEKAASAEKVTTTHLYTDALVCTHTPVQRQRCFMQTCMASHTHAQTCNADHARLWACIDTHTRAHTHPITHTLRQQKNDMCLR